MEGMDPILVGSGDFTTHFRLPILEGIDPILVGIGDFTTHFRLPILEGMDPILVGSGDFTTHFRLPILEGIDPILVGIGDFTTHFRTSYFGGGWDVHWGYDWDFDPWPSWKCGIPFWGGEHKGGAIQGGGGGESTGFRRGEKAGEGGGVVTLGSLGLTNPPPP